MLPDSLRIAYFVRVNLRNMQFAGNMAQIRFNIRIMTSPHLIKMKRITKSCGAQKNSRDDFSLN